MELKAITLIVIALALFQVCVSKKAKLSQDNEEVQEFDLSEGESDDHLDPDRILKIKPPHGPEKHPWYVNVPLRSLHQSLFLKVFNLLLRKGLFFNCEKTRNVTSYDFKSPATVLKSFDFSLGKRVKDENELVKYLEQIIDLSPHPSHPFYLARIGSGLDPHALAGEWLSAAVNNIVLTYYLAPVSTLMEMTYTKKLREIIGYPNAEGDGVSTSGASVANIMAVNIALQQKFPKFKMRGFITGEVPKFAIFISEAGGRSFIKAQIFTGFPPSSLVFVKVDSIGRMDPVALEAEIEKAKAKDIVPVMIVARVGTPMIGAIDPLEDLAKISKKYNIWFHVESRYPVILSQNQRWRVAGIEESDSVSYSNQKLGAMSPATFLLTRQPTILYDSFGHDATYVFFQHTTLYNITYDRGDSTIQTSRRAEIMKSWFMWKAKGQKGLGAIVDRQYENKDHFVKELQKTKRNNRFRMIVSEYCTPQVSFNYIPTMLSDSKMNKNSSKFQEELNTFTISLREKLMKNGIVYLSLSKCPRTPGYFLTASLTNTALTQDDIVYLVDQIAFYGESLDLDLKPKLDTVPPPPKSFPSFVNAPIKELHRKFFVDFFQLLLKKALFFQDKREEPPTRFRRPEELVLVMDLQLSNDSIGETQVLKELENSILYTPHYAHPYFVLQLMGGLNPYTIIADFVGASVNAPMLGYEGSPVMSLMETEVVKSVCRVTGYKQCDGVINDGGSYTNMIGMSLGRFHKFPETKTRGYEGKELVAFASTDAHYSFNKGGFFIGIGVKNVVMVPVDDRGRMNLTELKSLIAEAIKEGKIPYMIVATAGSTVFGSIDPIDQIADICDEHKLWLHVDAIYGGPLIFSKNKHRLKGIERSDSYGMNWHKLFAGTHTMAVMVSRHPGIFRKAMHVEKNVNGIFPHDNLYDRKKYDEIGDKQVQGARKANVVKFWFLWKAMGDEGLGLHIDHVFTLADFCVEELKRREGFEALLPEFDTLNVCFYYIPKKLRGMEKNETYFKELDLIAPELYTQLGKNGVVNIVAQNRNYPEVRFLKIPFLSSGVTKEDIKYILDVIEQYGEQL